MTARLSIIIPTFNEGVSLERAIRSVQPRDEVEIIVADGGSVDDTARVARALADRMVVAPLGRASQLNAGAHQASGDVLLFLHADARLAPGAVAAVRAALSDPRAVGGAFALRVESARPSLRLISWGINLRSRVLALPYGDQGLFVRSEVFRALGGFRPLDIMEDVDFVRRLRRTGRLALVRPELRTSDRRWRANGVLRTTLVNLGASALFRLAVPPHWIRRLYDGMLVSGRGAKETPGAGVLPLMADGAADRSSAKKEQILSDHRALGELLGTVERVREPEAAAPLLTELRGILQRHFQREEDPEGLFDIIESRAPEHGVRVQALLGEHHRLLGRLDELLKAAAPPAGDLLGRVAEFCLALREHERGESELLIDALSHPK